MDDFEKFRSLLLNRVHDWRSMIEHPKLFIDKYFSDTRTEIDLTIEVALQKLDKDTGTSKPLVQNDDSKQVRLPSLLFLWQMKYFRIKTDLLGH